MTHTPSQNVRFHCESVGGDKNEPPGHGLASRIQSVLRVAGFVATTIDNWRDCGWSMPVRVGDAEIEVALACDSSPNFWMLQISCMNDPGFLARMFGKRFIDRTDEVFRVACEVHEQLQRWACSSIRWCIDGYPEEEASTSEPQRAKQACR